MGRARRRGGALLRAGVPQRDRLDAPLPPGKKTRPLDATARHPQLRTHLPPAAYVFGIILSSIEESHFKTWCHLRPCSDIALLSYASPYLPIALQKFSLVTFRKSSETLNLE